MRRIIYIVVAIAMVVAVLRLIITGDMPAEGWFSQLSQAAENKIMQSFREQANPLFSGLRQHQIQYAEEVMSSRENLSRFNQRYCQSNDVNPYIYGNTRAEFCEQIQRTGILEDKR